MSIHISLKKLNKVFHDKQIIKDISLDVAEREVLAIVGCSGSGKSVLVKLIIGLMKPTSGDIIINNCGITGLKEKEFNVLMSKMSVLFQGGALFDSLKVWQNVCFELCQSRRLSKAEIKETALGYLNKVGLGSDVMTLYPAELSGGMQKRVALARALVKKPEIMFFDEPTTGLDPILAGVVDKLIIDCCVHKMTTIVITHNIKSACNMADKIAVLNKGSVVWHGASKDIFKAQNENVQALLRASSM